MYGAAGAGEDGAADGRDALGLVLGGPADAPEAAGLIREEGTLSLIEDEDVGRRSVRGETGEVRSSGERSSGAEQRPPERALVCAVPVADGVLTHAEEDSPGVHPLEEDGARAAAFEQRGGELSAVSPVGSGWVICRGLQAERSSAKRKLSAAPSTPTHTPKQIQRGNRPCRIDPLLDHTPIAVKTVREQQWFCKGRARPPCSDCFAAISTDMHRNLKTMYRSDIIPDDKKSKIDEIYESGGDLEDSAAAPVWLLQAELKAKGEKTTGSLAQLKVRYDLA